MIHIDLKPEPSYFNKEVRQKGLTHFVHKGIALDKPLLKGVEIEPYWRVCLDDLYHSYEGICAYLCVFFERVTGAGSVDHYAAKSQRLDLAYEWSNYRLACIRMNCYKREFEDVFDPIEIQNGWFRLELLNGHISPNPGLADDIKKRVKDTIDRLRLDEPEICTMRIRHYDCYIKNEITGAFFRRISPFVWYEANRQGLM